MFTYLVQNSGQEKAVVQEKKAAKPLSLRRRQLEIKSTVQFLVGMRILHKLVQNILILDGFLSRANEVLLKYVK